MTKKEISYYLMSVDDNEFVSGITNKNVTTIKSLGASAISSEDVETIKKLREVIYNLQGNEREFKVITVEEVDD